MAAYQLVIIGGGVSGLAAGIRAARFGIKTLIVEQHSLPGGLNSFYVRQGHLLETGLHAMTNCAPANDKQAPLNRLFRQLRLPRREFPCHEQIGSEIRFGGRSLLFGNDPAMLEASIDRVFPGRIDRFRRLRQRIAEYDPFAAGPWRSGRQFLADHLDDPELADTLLLPLMIYGNAEEEDMDLGQLVIMFRAVFEEGFFRPAATMREFLGLLVQQFRDFGGEIRFRSPVESIVTDRDRVVGVLLAGGEMLGADAVVSTAGIPETMRLSGWPGEVDRYVGRMSFMETISLVPRARAATLTRDRTIIFYHHGDRLEYRRPSDYLDPTWGVICFPGNFLGLPPEDPVQIRITNAASYPLWKALSAESYPLAKQRWTEAAVSASEEIVGNYRSSVVYQDSFTPMTIERFTRKAEGAVYGSAVKIKDGVTPWPNLFLAGTDQGYLGIVGAMLSGITMVNRHILR